MAEQTQVWKAVDGTFWSSRRQCLCYEMKRFFLNLGESAKTIKVDEMGRIDEAGLELLATMAYSTMEKTVPELVESKDG